MNVTIHLLVLLFAVSAVLEGQSASPPLATPSGPVSAPIAANERFYPKYKIEPIGNGDKVLIALDVGGGPQLNIVAEPLPAKDGGDVTQWAVFAGGGGTLYTKTFITVPGPGGTEGTRVEGISVTRLSAAAPVSASAPPARTAAHQTSNLYTTPSRQSADFRMPIRMDKPGFGPGRPRLWLLWDGQKEIQVEPVETKFKDSLWAVPVLGGDLNHLKYLSNIYTDGSVAPRDFFLRKNKDDSITIYGDDNLDKLKAIEKEKSK